MHPKSFVGQALPGPAGGAYSAPPDPLAGFKGAYFQGRGREKRGGRGGREGEALEPAPTHNFWLRHGTEAPRAAEQTAT